ncbi:MAG TPA: replication initiator, partial [Kineosporiaceae bacterium]|nr:replication initiator [Kineosporiaceae bacterium]
TLPSYGRVHAEDGTPVHPASYDYARAARDTIHFAKLLDRLVQNLRRVAGYDLQYFAVIEPQRRLAPHAHFAVRGTLPRELVRQVVAATYHQVWWPSTDQVVYAGDHAPAWDPRSGPEGAGGFVDPDTGVPLPTWDEALDAIGPDDEPAHVLRFGTQVDVKGVLSGTPDAEKCIGYLVKYLTKSLGDDLTATTHGDETASPADADSDHERAARWTAHRDRLVAALRYEPCSPTCPNWLRYGVQPRNTKAHQRPGTCRGKAHKPTHLGYGGRRVLTSHKWTGKTLADHKADRRAFVLNVLGVTPESDTYPGPQAAERIAWEHAKTTDPDVPPLSRRLLLAIAQRQRWRMEYRAARDNLPTPAATDLPATDPPDPDPSTIPHPAA